MDILRPLVIQGLERCFTFRFESVSFFNKISLVKTLTVRELRVELESLHKLKLSLGATDLERIYYSYSICSPLGKGSSGRTVFAHEVGVT